MSITIDIPKIPYPKVVFSVVAVVILAFVSLYGYNFYQEMNKPYLSPPDIVLNKTSYDIGDTVLVKIKHNAQNMTGSLVKWAIFDGDKEIASYVSYDDHVIFGTGNTPKNLRVVAGVAYTYKGGFTEYIATTLVKIGNAPIPPPPGPIPPVPPAPVVFPDGKFKLAQFTYESYNRLLVTEKKVELAKAYAGNFNSILSAIKAGAYKNKKAEDAFIDVANLNMESTKKFGIQFSVTDPFWINLQNELVKIEETIGLSQWSNLEAALSEIRDGLAAVK